MICVGSEDDHETLTISIKLECIQIQTKVDIGSVSRFTPQSSVDDSHSPRFFGGGKSKFRKQNEKKKKKVKVDMQEKMVSPQ